MLKTPLQTPTSAFPLQHWSQRTPLGLALPALSTHHLFHIFSSLHFLKEGLTVHREILV